MRCSAWCRTIRPLRAPFLRLLITSIRQRSSAPFAGLPEGALITSGATSYRISYVGGTGNDVTLTVEATADLAGPWTPLATSTNGTPFSGPGYLSGETPDASIKSVLVRDIIAVSSSPRRFIRLRVTR